MIENVYFDAWLLEHLQADAIPGGLFDPGRRPGEGARISGVWSETLPEGVDLPAVRFSDLAPRDVVGVSGQRILATGLYLIAVVVGGNDYGPAVAAANRLDELLTQADGSVLTEDGDTVWVLSCVRESVFKQEEPGEYAYRHLGGQYRLQGHKA